MYIYVYHVYILPIILIYTHFELLLNKFIVILFYSYYTFGVFTLNLSFPKVVLYPKIPRFLCGFQYGITSPPMSVKLESLPR